MRNAECRMTWSRRRLRAGGRPSFCTSRGFTLLELVLVMLVLSVVLAMVAPSLSGFGAGREAEFAGAQLMTLSRWAREQAITDGRVYRLNFNPSTNVYWVTAQVGGVFERVNNEFGQDFPLPDGVLMQWDAPQDGGAYCIDFHPSGRAQPAQVRITSRDDQVTIIGNRTATELLHVMTPQEAQAG
jgi:prepilin-type N-terminal cleavage/methylation domain-containing protein